jgi:hypothetical protein
MMEANIPVPFNKVQKNIVASTLIILKVALEMEDNPFGVAFFKHFNKEFSNHYDTIVKQITAQQDDSNILFSLEDFLVFYILLDVLVRHGRDNYLADFVEEVNETMGKKLDSPNIFERSQNISLSLAKEIFAMYDEAKSSKVIRRYLWYADRFPNPRTGISDALSAYNHIPKIPDAPRQISFKDYGHDATISMHLPKNSQIHMKNLHCAWTILIILRDKENPPAIILNAYFPTLMEDINLLLKKIDLKSPKKKVTRLTEGELGTLYACSDLYGKMGASSYHNLAEQLVINHPEGRHLPRLDSKVFEDISTLSRQAIDLDLVGINQQLSDLQVLADYRKVAAEMVWFDD